MERLRLAWSFGGDVKSYLADRCYGSAYMFGRCYEWQLFQSFHVWANECRAVASTDVRIDKDDADISLEDGSVVR